jgi:FtsP/CotA-like multicopper oxidase with cupredoxin domain
MTNDTPVTRRRALLLSGAAAAGFAVDRMSGVARAQASSASLPLPELIDARDGEPVTLTLQHSRHRFNGRDLAASAGISARYLGPVVRVRTGATIPVRVANDLGEETTLHWHGLLIPSEVDGGPHNVIAPGAVWTPELAVRQAPATTWFHPHPHGRTARQVYAGLAGMLIVSDGGDEDRGLPHVYGLDDLPVILQDKRFGRDGTPVYDPGMMDIMQGFRGDTLLVNGAIAPVAKVPAGVVRLRLLNAANARNFDLRFDDGRRFFAVAGDGGYLAGPVELRRLLIAPGERYEILVDFSDGAPASLITLPDPVVGAGMMMAPVPAPPSRRPLLHLVPDSALRAAVTRLPRQLAQLSAPDPGSAVQRRSFELNGMHGMMGMGMHGMMGMGMRGMGMGMRGRDFDQSGSPQIMGINGRAFSMHRVDVTAKLGTAEIWEVSANDMAHPFHVHGASFRILSNGGRPPSPEQTGWKDVALVQGRAALLVRFDHPAARQKPFMYHCHILEHEDHGMMGQLAVV